MGMGVGIDRHRRGRGRRAWASGVGMVASIGDLPSQYTIFSFPL